MFQGLRNAFGKVTQWAKGNEELFTDSRLSKRIDDGVLADVLSELEMELIASDVALPVAEKIKIEVSETLKEKRLKLGADPSIAILESLREAISAVLKQQAGDFDELVKGMMEKQKPAVIMFVGVNGTGKTTTIAKVAHRLMQNHQTCVLAAADTFRAGAIEQLTLHAERLGVRVVKQKAGADPAAVAFDAIEHAKAKHIDVVLIDTAGRMQTNINLMEEMKKIKRVAKPGLIIFVGDALTGNDAVEQALTFEREIGLDGAILCKIDADAKGGCALSIAYSLNKPIFFVGVGQEYKNLSKFNPDWMLKRIFSTDEKE
jgi:fused signal recognition particle receptor